MTQNASECSNAWLFSSILDEKMQLNYNKISWSTKNTQTNIEIFLKYI